MSMSTVDTLLAYSEWLDSEDEQSDRTHVGLVEEFIEHWESDPSRDTLAGRGEPVGPVEGTLL